MWDTTQPLACSRYFICSTTKCDLWPVLNLSPAYFHLTQILILMIPKYQWGLHHSSKCARTHLVNANSTLWFGKK